MPSKLLKGVKSLSILVLFLIGLFLIWLSVWQIDFDRSLESFTQSFGSSNVTKRDPSAPVIGELGGLKVSIPGEFARFVEYEGDPHFMEKRKGPSPEKTINSKIRSFGFEIRFPDGASRKIGTRGQEIVSLTPPVGWLGVGVNAAKDSYDYSRNLYKGLKDINLDGGLHALVYQKLPDKSFGLHVHEPAPMNMQKPGVPNYKNTQLDKNIFYAEDENGELNTYIECSNAKHDSAMCSQRIFLKDSIRLFIKVRYRKGLLKHWKEIKQFVSDTVLGFKYEGS